MSTDTRSETLQRLQSMNAELEAEAQMKRDAERYRQIRKFSIEEGSSWIDGQITTEAQFDERVDELLAELSAK